MRELTIGEAARRAGVGVETIRFYERRGLIDRPQKPQGAGFRVYAPEQVRRIRFIREAQQIGFSLREIAELLALEADPRPIARRCAGRPWRSLRRCGARLRSCNGSVRPWRL